MIVSNVSSALFFVLDYKLENILVVSIIGNPAVRRHLSDVPLLHYNAVLILAAEELEVVYIQCSVPFSDTLLWLRIHIYVATFIQFRLIDSFLPYPHRQMSFILIHNVWPASS